MIQYLLRRVLYALPILVGINLLTFALFFMVNTPDDMARMQLGQKHVTPIAIEQWKAERGYNLPLLYNDTQSGANRLTQTLFFQKSFRLFAFDFGRSDAGRDISYDISHRMWASLAIAVPSLILGLVVNIIFAMTMAFFRATALDLAGVIFCIILFC